MSFKRNTMIIYDLLGEGEMELVDGLSSIYLNKTPIVNSNKQHLVINRTFPATVNSASPSVLADFGGIYETGHWKPVRIQRGYKPTGLTTASVGATTITTAASFFESTMIATSTSATGGLIQKVRIKGAGIRGSEYVGEIVSINSTTSAVVTPPINTSVTNAEISFDYFNWAMVSSTGIEFLINPPVTGSFKIDVGAPGLETGLPDNPALNFKFVRASFRSGTLNQQPVVNIGGFSDASFGVPVNLALNQHPNFYGKKLIFGKDKTAVEYLTQGEDVVVDSSPNLPVTADRLLVTIGTSGLSSVKRTNQEKGDAGLSLQIFFEYKSGTGAWAVEQVFGPTDNDLNKAYAWVWNGQQTPLANYTNGDIYGRDAEPSDHEFSFNIDQYKPFDQFKVRIRRVTPVNYKMGSYDYTNATTVKSVQGFIEDRLAYPYSAYAAIMLDSQEFAGNIPERMYHCYGMRCEVPTNYFTRRETAGNYTATSIVAGREYTIRTVGTTNFMSIGASANTIGVVFTATAAGTGNGTVTATPTAAYTRNVTTGAETGVYQAWDGNFRTVYSDNPAWVLRSLLLENRFGLGNWLSADQINRYSFYAMARRCDELVPDGEGGMEPRFTCGVYLTKGTEAYKVIKDFCSIMLSIPFWMDGQLVLEADRPAEPVYTFTKSNIIGGLFSYEGTGNKTRPNQIAVSFNDRKNFYTQAVELVDDVEDMIAKNRVYSEEAVAFGATSRSQAIRYGKWKLLTSKLNKELISFKTGENAGFIRPGSVIQIQDADRYRIRNSGRVLSSTTSSILIDKPITLGSGTYTLHVLVAGPAAYLAQATAVIGAVTYKQGDIIAGIDTEEEAAELVDDSFKPVQVTWAPDTHLENRVVTTVAGSNISTLTVSPNFSAAPQVEFIWALTNTLNNATVEGSSKLYRVLGIAEDGPGTYSITASEHFNSKFDSLDETYLSEDNEIIPFDEVIPPITNFTASINIKSLNDSTVDVSTSKDIILRWTPPMADAVNSTSSMYANLAEYILKIISPTGLQVIKLPNTATTYTLENVADGPYDFDLQAKSLTGAVTSSIYATLSVTSTATGISGSINQLGVPRGGHFSTAPILDGRTIKAPNDYIFNGASGATKIVSGGL